MKNHLKWVIIVWIHIMESKRMGKEKVVKRMKEQRKDRVREQHDENGVNLIHINEGNKVRTLL